MSCDMWIEALSAAADGEDPGVDPRLLEAHVSKCASCRAFAADVGDIGRAARVAASPTMPDLSHRVAKLAAVADRARVGAVLRLMLAGVAVTVAISSIPELVFAEHGGGITHDARHSGAFSLAFAVGLMVVAVRPARARTMLPVTFVVASALAVTAVLDAVEGHVTFLAEGRHIPELVSLVLVWLLARATGATSSATVGSSGGLRLVPTDDAADHREVG